jgi:hypothetical protein
MQRLNNSTLYDFLAEPGVAAVMFGAPEGEATMDQAEHFAEAWLDCHDDANFGYVDAFADVAAARNCAVRVLPTTMIVSDGEVVGWIEGRHSSVRIAQSIRAALSARPVHAAAA